MLHPLTDTFTQRDFVEQAIIRLVPEKLFLPDFIWPTINAMKSGNFGFSYLGFSLYANGCNDHSISTQYPRGLVYFNKETGVVFGIGVFFRPADVPNVHIIAPQGDWQKEVGEFADRLQAEIPAANIYVRHLIKGSLEAGESMLQQADMQHLPIGTTRRELELYKTGFSPISVRPWIPAEGNKPAVAQEDEQENNGRIFVLSRLLSDRPKEFNKKAWIGLWNATGVELPGYESVIDPRRVWLTENRFKNFLERNDLEYALLPYEQKHKGLAEEVVGSHFKHLNDSEKAIGSTAADYANLINADTALIPGIHMYIGVLRKVNNHARFTPVSFFGFEEINRPGAKKMAGGYATITRRHNEVAAPLVDIGLIEEGSGVAEHMNSLTGFSAIAFYAMRQVMKELHRDKGIKVIDLGGSETKDLARGKQHMGGQPRETFWVVKTGAKGPSAAALSAK